MTWKTAMMKVEEKSRSKLDLSMPVRYLKGVGPVRAGTFAQLGVETVGDLLEYFPRDWNFLPESIKINQMRPDHTVTIVGMVESIDYQNYRRQPILVESIDYQNYRRQPIFEALISDDTGVCRIVWFHGGFLRNQLEPGQIIMASGKVALYKHQLQLTNPKFLVLDEKHSQSSEYFSGGIYPACSKLSSRQIKRIIAPLLDSLTELVSEFYDKSFLKKANLIGRRDAFAWIHLPPDEERLAQAKRRLKYDELFLNRASTPMKSTAESENVFHFC
ncbi:MAG: OB-fold nucleic acid binding domain-containing protein [Planctomycetota bacterium]|jgi:ATP-dependent DNA helicase RecG